MLLKTENCSQILISSVDKFFFSIFEKILPEIKESLFHELRNKTEILQNQKSRIQNVLMILEKELSKSQEFIRNNSAQEIITMKANLFDSLSEMSKTFLVPQRTDNFNLSCENCIFNQPDFPFIPRDEKGIVSSIADSFNKFFDVQLSIPTLKKIHEESKTEKSKRVKPDIRKQNQKTQDKSKLKERKK
jgi:hypothetical protein